MLDHLEDNIRRVISGIRPQMLGKVIENLTSRLDYIRASRGSPMPEIIFKIGQFFFQLSFHPEHCKGCVTSFLNRITIWLPIYIIIAAYRVSDETPNSKQNMRIYDSLLDGKMGTRDSMSLSLIFFLPNVVRIEVYLHSLHISDFIVPENECWR
ncbi:hypothetical protein TNCV_5017291 [Trichonephila clavipes]|nr:hypothetical protein TNCV_5017291 [Trichonephila clavipes]